MKQVFAEARSKVRRAFSNRPNVIQTRSGTEPLDVQSMHPHWIVGRGLCMFRCESFDNVPRTKRGAALALKLPIWSPFERTGHHCAWAGPLAMVWMWNQAEVDAARENHGPLSSAADVRVLPESVFQPKPPQGVHVQECAEGHDLQHWRDGVLRDAYWQAEPPTPETVAWFIDRQQSPDAAQPADAAFQPAQLESEPWPGLETPTQWLLARERAIVAACVGALVLPLAWQEARIWKMRGLAENTSAEMAEMQADLDPVLGARDEWRNLRERNQVLAAILAEPSQAYVMGLVDVAIPNPAARLHSWRYQQRQLRFLVEDAELDPVEYTRALEAQPLFDQVRMQPMRRAGQFEITLELVVAGTATT